MMVLMYSADATCIILPARIQMVTWGFISVPRCEETYPQFLSGLEVHTEASSWEGENTDQAFGQTFEKIGKR